MAAKRTHRNTKTYRTTRRARRIRSALDVCMKLSLLFIATVCLTVLAFQARQFIKGDTGRQLIARAAAVLPGSGNSSVREGSNGKSPGTDGPGGATGTSRLKFFAKAAGLPSRAEDNSPGINPDLQNQPEQEAQREALAGLQPGPGQTQDSQPGSSQAQGPQNSSGYIQGLQSGSGLTQNPQNSSSLTQNPQNGSGLTQNPQNSSGLTQDPQSGSGLTQGSQHDSSLPQGAQNDSSQPQAPQPDPSQTQAPPPEESQNDSRPMIAFTFDDGPYAPVDNRILDVLAAYGGRATFFVVGNRVNDYTTDLKRIAESGSEIGNHTFDHKNLEKLAPADLSHQIESTNDAVEAVTGFRPSLVRVPYGAFKGQVTTLAGYPLIQWDVDTEDWKSKDKDQVVQSILSHAKDGSIILMHDLYPSTAEAVEEVVPLLVEQGFQLVTVSELYKAKGASLEPGNVYFGRP